MFVDRIRPVCLPFKAVNPSDSTLYRLIRNNSNIDLPTGFNAQKHTMVEIEKCKNIVHPREYQESVCTKIENSETRQGTRGDPIFFSINEHGAYPIYQVALDVGLWEGSPGVFKRIHPYIEWISDTIDGNINKTRNRIYFPDSNIKIIM